MDSDAGDTRASTPINSTQSTHSASDFLADGKYYDVLVHSCEENGDATYLKLHRLIACPQSEMLASLCEKAQKTSKPPEVLTIRVDADTQTLTAMVSYLYNKDYSFENGHVPTFQLTEAATRGDPNVRPHLVPKQTIPYSSDQTTSDTNQQLLLHAKVYALARSFQVPSLESLATSKFYEVLERYIPSTMPEVTTEDDRPEWLSSDLDGFDAVASKVYCITDDGDTTLRQPLVRFAHRYRKELCLNEEGVNIDYETQDFLKDFHATWIAKEIAIGNAKDAQIAELTKKLDSQVPNAAALQDEVNNLTSDKEHLQQENGQLVQSHTAMNSLFVAIKVMLHGKTATQCTVTLETEQKKRKRGKEGNEVVFHCSCGQSLGLEKVTAKGSLLGSWL